MTYNQNGPSMAAEVERYLMLEPTRRLEAHEVIRAAYRYYTLERIGYRADFPTFLSILLQRVNQELQAATSRAYYEALEAWIAARQPANGRGP